MLVGETFFVKLWTLKCIYNILSFVKSRQLNQEIMELKSQLEEKESKTVNDIPTEEEEQARKKLQLHLYVCFSETIIFFWLPNDRRKWTSTSSQTSSFLKST